MEANFAHHKILLNLKKKIKRINVSEKRTSEVHPVHFALFFILIHHHTYLYYRLYKIYVFVIRFDIR